MRKLAAFSLIEIIIVISIVSAVAAFSFFSYSSYLSSMKLKAAVLQIRSDLITCQNKARTEHAAYTIEFSDNIYTINYLKTIKLPAQVTVEPRTFKFSSSGFPPPGYFGTLIVRCKNKTKNIIVSSLGRIRIE